MKIDRQYMTVIMHKALEDLKAKEFDYASNNVKIQIALGKEEISVLLEALAEKGGEEWVKQKNSL